MSILNRIICWFFGHYAGRIECRIESHQRTHAFLCSRCGARVAVEDGNQFPL